MAGRKLKTFEDYKRALKNKYGLGEGISYKPWLRVQDVKSKGVRSQILGLKTNRIHHTLSSIETDFFYLAEYCDSVIDIREQFPLFPINLSIKIAKTLGVEHPTHPETDVSIIMTTDFLLTRQIDNKVFYEAISVKPENKSDDKRVLEKLEIERVWWELLNIKFSYYIDNEYTQIQSSNINWVTHPMRTNVDLFSLYDLEVALSLIPLGKQFIRDICNSFVDNIDVPHEDALNVLRCLIAQKKLHVDLSYPLESSDYINVLKVNLTKENRISANS